MSPNIKHAAPVAVASRTLPHMMHQPSSQDPSSVHSSDRSRFSSTATSSITTYETGDDSGQSCATSISETGVDGVPGPVTAAHHEYAAGTVDEQEELDLGKSDAGSVRGDAGAYYAKTAYEPRTTNVYHTSSNSGRQARNATGDYGGSSGFRQLTVGYDAHEGYSKKDSYSGLEAPVYTTSGGPPRHTSGAAPVVYTSDGFAIPSKSYGDATASRHANSSYPTADSVSRSGNGSVAGSHSNESFKSSSKGSSAPRQQNSSQDSRLHSDRHGDRLGSGSSTSGRALGHFSGANVTRLTGGSYVGSSTPRQRDTSTPDGDSRSSTPQHVEKRQSGTSTAAHHGGGAATPQYSDAPSRYTNLSARSAYSGSTTPQYVDSGRHSGPSTPRVAEEQRAVVPVKTTRAQPRDSTRGTTSSRPSRMPSTTQLTDSYSGAMVVSPPTSRSASRAPTSISPAVPWSNGPSLHEFVRDARSNAWDSASVCSSVSLGRSMHGGRAEWSLVPQQQRQQSISRAPSVSGDSVAHEKPHYRSVSRAGSVRMITSPQDAPAPPPASRRAPSRAPSRAGSVCSVATSMNYRYPYAYESRGAGFKLPRNVDQLLESLWPMYVELATRSALEPTELINLVFVGRPGAGKTATINSIYPPKIRAAGESAFKGQARDPGDRVKKLNGANVTISLEERTLNCDGVPNGHREAHAVRRLRAKLYSPRQKSPLVLVFFVVFRLDELMTAAADIAVMTRQLGPALWSRAVIVLTHGNMLRPAGCGSWREYVDAQKKHLLAAVESQTGRSAKAVQVVVVENSSLASRDACGQVVLRNGQPCWREIAGCAEALLRAGATALDLGSCDHLERMPPPPPNKALQTLLANIGMSIAGFTGSLLLNAVGQLLFH